MDEKKELKVSLSSVISVFIISILIITLGITYYFGFIKNKEEINKLKAKEIDLENKIKELKNNSNQVVEKDTSTNDNKKEILKKNFDCSTGYSFNMKVSELTDELMKSIENSDSAGTVKSKEISGGIDWVAVGWFSNDENLVEVTGINIYSANDYVTEIQCTPAKYGSGDVSAIVVPENLYNEAKRILGSETEEWKELEKEGKITEKIYDAFNNDFSINS